MKKRLYIYAWGLAAILFASCSEEKQVDGGPAKPEQQTDLILPISLKGPYDTNDDSRVATARLIVFRSQSSTLEPGKRVVNSYKTGTGLSIPFQEIVPVGKIDIYMFANEPTAWNLWDSSITPAIIKAKTLNFTAHPLVNATNSVPMFKYYENVDIDVQGNLSRNGVPLDLSHETVERLYAKVVVSMVFNTPGGTGMTIGNLQMFNMPRASYIIPKPYNLSFFNGAITAPVIDAAENLAIGKVNRQYTFYIPECLSMNNALSGRTYLAIAAQNRNFSIVIGEGITSHDNDYMKDPLLPTTDDLTIKRNTCYLLKIKSITGDFLINFTVEVLPWSATIEVPLH